MIPNSPCDIDRLLAIAAKLGHDLDTLEALANEHLEQKAHERAVATMSDYDRGYSDATKDTNYGPRDPEDEESQESYSEGHADGAQYLEDLRVDQIENDYLDGECSLSGHYYT